MKQRSIVGKLLLAIVCTLGPGSALADQSAMPDVCSNGSSGGAVNFAIEDGIVSSIWDNGTVSLAIPLSNVGTRPATNVTIKTISAPSANYLGPAEFPYAIGTIPPDKRMQVNALFSMSSLLSQGTYPVIVGGTYQVGSANCVFSVQAFVKPTPTGNGEVTKHTTIVQTFTADTAVYPPAPFPHLDELPNGDLEEVLLPLGEPRYLFKTPPPLRSLDTELAFHPIEYLPPPPNDPHAVVFLRNTISGTTGGLPPDPSAAGATPSGFVMTSYNTKVSYSTDFGKTFTTVNLTGATGFSDLTNPSRPDFFPESDGGLCCDQVVIYIPSRNLMVWLLQYNPASIDITPVSGPKYTITLQNELRIAWATPEAAANDFLHAWKWFDITGVNLEEAITEWLDYPDLAYSNDDLYISVDHGFVDFTKNPPATGKAYSDSRFFIRVSLDQLLDPSSGIVLNWYEAFAPNLSKARFVQSSPDTMYYAAEKDTSTINVFADPDSSALVPTPHEVAVSSFCSSKDFSGCVWPVIALDNLDWNQDFKNVLGGTYVAPSFFCPPEGCDFPTRFLYFAFDGGADPANGRPYPYVRVEKLDADTLNLVAEYDIWTNDRAFATPALVWRPGSGKDEVAFSLAIGGGGTYADNAVGFLDDDVVYRTTSSDVTQARYTYDASGKIITGTVVRYGDYFNVRNAVGPITLAGQGVGYATLNYSVLRANPAQLCAAAGCTASLRYILFGRSGDLFPHPPPPPPH